LIIFAIKAKLLEPGFDYR